MGSDSLGSKAQAKRSARPWRTMTRSSRSTPCSATVGRMAGWPGLGLSGGRRGGLGEGQGLVGGVRDGGFFRV